MANTGEGELPFARMTRMEQLHMSGKMGDSEVWSDGQDEDGEGAAVCSIFTLFLPFCSFVVSSVVPWRLLTFFSSCLTPSLFPHSYLSCHSCFGMLIHNHSSWPSGQNWKNKKKRRSGCASQLACFLGRWQLPTLENAGVVIVWVEGTQE